MNSLYICLTYLYAVATSTWESQKTSNFLTFQQYYSYLVWITYVISEENKLLPPFPPHLKKITSLPRKFEMQNFYT